MGQGDKEDLLHLGGAGGHPVQGGAVHHPQHGLHEEVGPVGDKVQPSQQPDPLGRNGQLLPGLTQGAVLGALPLLHKPAGEADLPGLAAQGPGPDLIEQAQLPVLFHQGDQHRVGPLGIHQAGGAVLQQGLQPLQLHTAHPPRLADSMDRKSTVLIMAPVR